MFLQERQAALNSPLQQSQEEIDLENLPIEEFQTRVKQTLQDEGAVQNAPQIQMNADAFLTIRPEIADTERNANLIRMQLRANGVTDGSVSIEQFDKATNQLRGSGLLTLNKVQLDKQ